MHISLKSIDGKNVVTEEVEKLCSSHEEADTRMILHCNDVAANSPESSVILVRSPDTEVFILFPRFVRHINQTVLVKPGEVLTSYNGVDMSHLPPCRESLKMHATPSIPLPDGHGWNTNVEGELEICWTNGNLMPQELADIITGPLNPSSKDEEDVTVDYEDISDVVFENDF
ncbi:unnamed protein product [Porites lobata]|uniref:Uncharacterized protein n=1 Tax=Porites lobata TaxID=104759 RepID=A0ABN8QLU9_9CNID|nr:unnamed protein product [Porites lobata]